MIKADIHLHSSYSGDSDEPMENMILEGIHKGLDYMCFTEHMDLDFPKNDKDPDNIFILDTDSYLDGFKKLRDKYSSKITLLYGVELGLQPHLAETHSEYVSKYPFDYVIGSEHTTCKKDPYYPDFYKGRTEFEAYSEYFKDISDNLDAFSKIDSLGHLDYVVRYGPNKNQNYSYIKYADYIDAILNRLIQNGIGLEVNSGGYKYGLNNPNPASEILIRYKELGGEIITIGSDAHSTDRIAADFTKIEALLKGLGFKYYAVYQNHKPKFFEL